MKQFIHRLAEEDLAEAVRFYKSEAGTGLARRFLAEFERVAKLLERHPGLGTPTADGRRVREDVLHFDIDPGTTRGTS